MLLWTLEIWNKRPSTINMKLINDMLEATTNLVEWYREPTYISEYNYWLNLLTEGLYSLYLVSESLSLFTSSHRMLIAIILRMSVCLLVGWLDFEKRFNEVAAKLAYVSKKNGSRRQADLQII